VLDHGWRLCPESEPTDQPWTAGRSFGVIRPPPRRPRCSTRMSSAWCRSDAGVQPGEQRPGRRLRAHLQARLRERARAPRRGECARASSRLGSTTTTARRRTRRSGCGARRTTARCVSEQRTHAPSIQPSTGYIAFPARCEEHEYDRDLRREGGARHRSWWRHRSCRGQGFRRSRRLGGFLLTGTSS